MDLIIFNPPYVSTTDEELKEAKDDKGVSASWAGGEDGAQVIKEFIV